MKCRLFKLVLFLFLGAIVNIAVAWGCALWPSTNSEISIDSKLGNKKYDSALVPRQLRKFHESHRAPWMKIFNEIRSSRLTSGYNVYTIRYLTKAKHYLESAELSVGWPAPSLAAYHTFHNKRRKTDRSKEMWESERGFGTRGRGPYFSYFSRPGKTDHQTDRIDEEWESGTMLVLGERRGISGRPLWPPQRLLPFYPMWSGFAINTILYAIVLKVLMIVPWLMRRNSRLLKGHCPKCNQSLRGNYSSGCPECGWGREAEA